MCLKHNLRRCHVYSCQKQVYLAHISSMRRPEQMAVARFANFILLLLTCCSFMKDISRNTNVSGFSEHNSVYLMTFVGLNHCDDKFLRQWTF